MSKVKTDTIVRTEVLGISLINQIIVMCGLNPLPFADDEIYAFVSTLVTVAAVIWSWWKNNSLTKSAQTADEVKDAIKAGTITTEQAENLANGKE